MATHHFRRVSKDGEHRSQEGMECIPCLEISSNNIDEFIEMSMRYRLIILGGNMEWPACQIETYGS